MEESLPDVAELQDQFAAQQSMIEQMRDTLLQREQTNSSNEKKAQDFAATLSRIRSHRPNKKKNEDVKSPMALDVTPEKGPSSKMTLLRKQMEENRAILEQRGKLINEHKQSVEGMVEKLSAQLSEKDFAVEEMRRSRQVEESFPSLNTSSEECREIYAQVIARDNKIIELNNRILQLETSIMDYEESLREKESVLEARTRAVALLQEDLGLKHASALKHLEEARKEAADLKFSLAEKEKQLKIDKQNLLDTIASKDQKVKQLETVRFELCTKNADLQHKIVALQTKSHEVLSQGLPQDKETIQELELKIGELEKSTSEEIQALTTKLEENTKLLAKTKVAYSKKIKTYEQKLQKQQPSLQELEQKIAMLEEEKGNLQLTLVDFEEMKATENGLKKKVSDMEAETLQQKSKLEEQSSTIKELESTSSSAHHELQNLRASEAELQAELEASKGMVQESECAVVRANMKTVELEERLEQAEKAYNELTTEVEQLLAQKDTTDNSNQLQDVLDSAEQDKSSLRTELEQLKSQLVAQEAVAREASEALLHAQQTLSLKVTEHEAEIESLQGQIAAKEERASLLEERIAALTDESQANLERLNQSVHEAEIVQHELAKAESVVSEEGHRLGDAEQRIHALEAQIQELKNALELANQVQKDESEARSHAQAEVRELRMQLESSAVQLESVAETVAQLENLKMEHSKLVKRFQDEIASWQSRCGVAEDEASAAATQLEQRSKDHQVAMEGWNKEMEVLKNHINGLEDSNNDLYEQIDNLGLEKESVQSELWSLQEELAALKETQVKSEEFLQSQAENENQAMNQLVQEHTAKVAELEQTIANFHAQFSNQQNVIAQFQQEYQKLVESKQSSEEACEGLKSQLKSKEENFQQLQAECLKLQTLNGDLGSQLHSNQSLESNFQGLASQLTAQTEELNQLRWALGEKDLALQSLSQQIQSYEDETAQLKSSVHHLELSLNESDAQKQQLMSNFENNQAEMSHLQSQASAKDAATNYRISELEKVNSSLQATLDQQKSSFEHDASKLVAEVERLNQQLIEAQTINKTTLVPDEISWGEEPTWQEPTPTIVDNSNALLVEALQKQLQEAETTQAKLAEDLRVSQVRCGKALKQLKTIKEQKQPPPAQSDLSKVIEEELQSQVTALRKELEEVKSERLSLASKADTLKDANIRLTESKKQLDLEIEHLKVERLALEEEASDWGQDNRVEVLEKRLQDAYERCKELEDHIAGDDETESENILLQDSLVKSRERCAELEKLRMADEEKLQKLEEQLAATAAQIESLKSSMPSSEVVIQPQVSDVVTQTPAYDVVTQTQVSEVMAVKEQAPVVETVRPSMEEAHTMTEEVSRVEASVNTDQQTVAPEVALATPVQPTDASEEAAYEMAKVRAILAQREQEAQGLAALVAQMRTALDAKSQELALLSPDTHSKHDLDSALYLLHQRDVRCDELTLELMALMEERDALQMRLSSALRVNATQADQLKEVGVSPQSEELTLKLSELHSLGHKRDVMLRGEQESRHTMQQAALLPSPSLHFTPNQRTLPTDGESIPFGAPPGTEIAPVPRPDPPQQEGSSGLLGWLWGY